LELIIQAGAYDVAGGSLHVRESIAKRAESLGAKSRGFVFKNRNLTLGRFNR